MSVHTQRNTNRKPTMFIQANSRQQARDIAKQHNARVIDARQDKQGWIVVKMPAKRPVLFDESNNVGQALSNRGNIVNVYTKH